MSFRKFRAAAASRNSSFAPLNPRKRSLWKLRLRLSCAKHISTFFRRRDERLYSGVSLKPRTCSRSAS